MGCNCKGNKVTDTVVGTGTTENTKFSVKQIIKTTFRVIGFLLILLVLPILNLYIIWFMFKSLVLNKELDIQPLLVAIGEKFKPVEKEDEEVDEPNTEFEYELQDVEVIR